MKSYPHQHYEDCRLPLPLRRRSAIPAHATFRNSLYPKLIFNPDVFLMRCHRRRIAVSKCNADVINQYRQALTHHTILIILPIHNKRQLSMSIRGYKESLFHATQSTVRMQTAVYYTRQYNLFST